MQNAYNANMIDGIKTKPCVNCGYCCMLAPCTYGERDKVTGWCVYLIKKEGVFEQYVCQKYKEISAQKGSWLHPAFGAGCSSTLFNEQRNRVIARLKAAGNYDSGC